MEQDERTAGQRGSGAEVTDVEQLHRMEVAFRRLRRRHQHILIMLQSEQLTYAEIAERLGIGINAVERRVAAALVALDRAIEAAARRPWWRFW